MICQACLSKSSNLFETEKRLVKKNLSDVHKKPFSKVLLSRLVNFKIRFISLMKGVLFHRLPKKT